MHLVTYGKVRVTFRKLYFKVMLYLCSTSSSYSVSQFKVMDSKIVIDSTKGEAIS